MVKGLAVNHFLTVMLCVLFRLLLLWYWWWSIIDQLYQNRCPQRLMTASRAVSRHMLHSKVARSLSRSPSALPPGPAPPPLPGTPAPLAVAPSLELRCCSAASILSRSHSLRLHSYFSLSRGRDAMPVTSPSHSARALPLAALTCFSFFLKIIFQEKLQWCKHTPF